METQTNPKAADREEVKRLAADFDVANQAGASRLQLLEEILAAGVGALSVNPRFNGPATPADCARIGRRAAMLLTQLPAVLQDLEMEAFGAQANAEILEATNQLIAERMGAVLN